MNRFKFISGANDEPRAKKAKKRKSQNILLSVTGKIDDRSAHARVLLYIDPELGEKIDRYCTGSKQSIYTYLINKGLNQLIKEDKMIIHEANSHDE